MADVSCGLPRDQSGEKIVGPSGGSLVFPEVAPRPIDLGVSCVEAQPSEARAPVLRAIAMIIKLRNPTREVTVDGPRAAGRILEDLGLAREAHLVIRNGTLVPGDAVLDDADTVEIRPVISGG